MDTLLTPLGLQYLTPVLPSKWMPFSFCWGSNTSCQSCPSACPSLYSDFDTSRREVGASHSPRVWTTWSKLSLPELDSKDIGSDNEVELPWFFFIMFFLCVSLSLDSPMKGTGQEERIVSRAELENFNTLNYYVSKLRPNKWWRCKDKNGKV